MCSLRVRGSSIRKGKDHNVSSPNVVPLDTKIDSDPDSKVWVQACSISIERKGIHPAFIPVKTEKSNSEGCTVAPGGVILREKPRLG